MYPEGSCRGLGQEGRLPGILGHVLLQFEGKSNLPHLYAKINICPIDRLGLRTKYILCNSVLTGCTFEYDSYTREGL